MGERVAEVNKPKDGTSAGNDRGRRAAAAFLGLEPQTQGRQRKASDKRHTDRRHRPESRAIGCAYDVAE